MIVGSQQGLSAPAPQTLGGRTYGFASWSDGGAQSHQITAPTAPATYRATFTEQSSEPGLVGAWAFDEASGAQAADASGRGNHGTIAGATRAAAGRFGGALAFDGVDDWVTVADAASLDLTTGMTLEAWVNPSANGAAWRTAMLKEHGGTLAYGLYGHDGARGPSAHVNPGSDQSATRTTALALNTWSHLAATYDGTTLRLYLNGAQVATRAVTGALQASSGPLRFGGNGVWAGEFFQGRLDELRVYNRALTAAEVAADMTRPVGPQAPARLGVSPASLSFSGAQGGPQPAAKTLSVANEGGGSLSFSASDDAPWLTVTPGSGSAPQTLNVQASTAGLAQGTYNATVTVTSAGTAGSPASIPVTLTVGAPAPPALAVTPASLSFAATAGGSAPAAKTLDVANSGSGSLTFSASDDAAWLSVTPASGTAPQTLSVSASPAGLAAGTYNATVTVTASGATGSPKTVPVTLTVSPPASDLAAAYGFDEASGASVADASPNGNTGTIAGATRTADGRFGGALSFDGVNDMVTVPDAASLDLTAGMTLEAWVYPTATGTAWRTVMLKERPGGLAYGIYGNNDAGRPEAYAFTGTELGAPGTAGLPLNTWSHVAATFSASTLRLYVGGVQVATRAVGAALRTSNNPLRIGGNSIWGEWFAGRIDEVRVYNRALSAAEIGADMNRRVSP